MTKAETKSEIDAFLRKLKLNRDAYTSRMSTLLDEKKETDNQLAFAQSVKRAKDREITDYRALHMRYKSEIRDKLRALRTWHGHLLFCGNKNCEHTVPQL